MKKQVIANNEQSYKTVKDTSISEFVEVYCENCEKYSRAIAVEEIETTSSTTQYKQVELNKTLYAILSLCLLIPGMIYKAIVDHLNSKRAADFKTSSTSQIHYCCKFCGLATYVSKTTGFLGEKIVSNASKETLSKSSKENKAVQETQNEIVEETEAATTEGQLQPVKFR